MTDTEQREQELQERIRELEDENARLKKLILKLKGQRSSDSSNMSTMLREALRE